MSIFSGSSSDPFPQLPEFSLSSSDFHESYSSSSSPLSEEVLQSVIVNSSDNKQSKLENEVILASKNPKKRAGRIKFHETRHPVYRGIRRRNGGKWVCEIREPNKKSRIWLGTFPTAEMAARAHDVAVIALRGKSACVNFADSAWRLPVPVSTNPKDIQRAAAEAAEAFRPSENQGLEEPPSMPVSPPPCSDGGAVAAKLSENVPTYFIDDEVVFDMPGFISDMAIALMLPQPLSHCGIFQEDADVSVSLWSYSNSFF